jgi:hypothetical protein
MKGTGINSVVSMLAAVLPVPASPDFRSSQRYLMIF